jgi:type VI secretion system secreted protein Hcp
MASDIYLQIDGLKGESTDSEHKDWIEIHSFNHSISQPASATANSAGGGTTSRCQHQDYSISKYVDLASPKLYELACSGKHIKDVTIEMMRASGDKRVKYMVVKMEQVVISHVAPSGGADFPSESVSFNYGTIKWTYTQQKRADGSQGGNAAGGWSLVENKVSA